MGHQPFPEHGQLSKNLNLTADGLRSRLLVPEFRDANVYCYVVATVKSGGPGFVQTGSAPNFQGGVITLCTCKHFMRSLLDPGEWRGKWIAGFTGLEAGARRNALVYLMQVGRGFQSHLELWRSDALTTEAKEAKAADANRFGDLYRPAAEVNAEFHPSGYGEPMPGHVHHDPKDWHQDICYRSARSDRVAALLTGEASRSFLWSKPIVYLKQTSRVGLGRGHRKWPLGTLLDEHLKDT